MASAAPQPAGEPAGGTKQALRAVARSRSAASAYAAPCSGRNRTARQLVFRERCRPGVAGNSHQPSSARSNFRHRLMAGQMPLCRFSGADDRPRSASPCQAHRHAPPRPRLQQEMSTRRRCCRSRRATCRTADRRPPGPCRHHSERGDNQVLAAAGLSEVAIGVAAPPGLGDQLDVTLWIAVLETLQEHRLPAAVGGDAIPPKRGFSKSRPTRGVGAFEEACPWPEAVNPVRQGIR